MAIQAKFYSENIGFSLIDNNNNACGFNNIYQQQQQQEEQQQQQQQQYLMQFDQFQNLSQGKKVSFLLENNMNDQSSMGFGQSILEHAEKQKMEIDRFVTLQNERLRLLLQDHRKQQTVQFLKAHQQKIHFLLKSKEEEIAKASNTTLELEQYVKRVETENQTWQRLAKEHESTVSLLNSTIERLRETSATLLGNAVDDSESCCDENNREERKMVCKCCKSRDSCVIMLPCRHLCSCRECEAFLDFCPVCRVVKKGSVEALLV